VILMKCLLTVNFLTEFTVRGFVSTGKFKRYSEITFLVDIGGLLKSTVAMNSLILLIISDF
jgi:hypothetical protein